MVNKSKYTGPIDPLGYRNCSHQSPSPFLVHFFAAKDLDAAVLSRVPLHIEFGRPEAELLQKQVDRASRRGQFFCDRGLWSQPPQPIYDRIFVTSDLCLAASRWFQIFFNFIPTWGDDAIWLIFFKRGWNHQPENVSPPIRPFSFPQKIVSKFFFLHEGWECVERGELFLHDFWNGHWLFCSKLEIFGFLVPGVGSCWETTRESCRWTAVSAAQAERRSHCPLGQVDLRLKGTRRAQGHHFNSF